MRELRDTGWKRKIISFLTERLRVLKWGRGIIERVPAAEPGTASRCVMVTYASALAKYPLRKPGCDAVERLHEGTCTGSRSETGG